MYNLGVKNRVRIIYQIIMIVKAVSHINPTSQINIYLSIYLSNECENFVIITRTIGDSEHLARLLRQVPFHAITVNEIRTFQF
jgi:hypothetical protein